MPHETTMHPDMHETVPAPLPPEATHIEAVDVLGAYGISEAQRRFMSEDEQQVLKLHLDRIDEAVNLGMIDTKDFRAASLMKKLAAMDDTQWNRAQTVMNRHPKKAATILGSPAWGEVVKAMDENEGFSDALDEAIETISDPIILERTLWGVKRWAGKGPETIGRDMRLLEELGTIEAVNPKDIEVSAFGNITQETIDLVRQCPEQIRSAFVRTIHWRRDNAADQQARLSFLEQLGEKVVQASTKTPYSQSGKFMRKEMGFLEPVLERFGIDAIRESLANDPDSFEALNTLHIASDNMLLTVPTEAMEQRRGQELEYSVSENVEARDAEKIRVFLRSSGLEQFYNLGADQIRIVSIDEGKGVAGNWSRIESTMTIVAGVPNKKLAGTLVHETGHVASMMVTATREGQRDFFRYALEVAYGAPNGTEYSEAYALIKNRADTVFIQESFAEDFRLYMLDPDSVSPERRVILERINQDMETIGIDLDDIRDKLRSTNGNLFGLSSKQVAQRKHECSGPKQVAMRIERVKAENERDRKDNSRQ